MGSFRGAHGERVEREPITEIWGQSPWSGEAESFLALGRTTDKANLHPLQFFQQSSTIR